MEAPETALQSQAGLARLFESSQASQPSEESHVPRARAWLNVPAVLSPRDV